MTTYPFVIDDRVSVDGRIGTVVIIKRNLELDLVKEISVRFDDNGGHEWFDEDELDDIDLVEEA